MVNEEEQKHKLTLKEIFNTSTLTDGPMTVTKAAELVPGAVAGFVGGLLCVWSRGAIEILVFFGAGAGWSAWKNRGGVPGDKP
eukprot:g78892.t1